MRCRICDTPLQYIGRGAPPEMHRACRDLGNDLDRVRRSLEFAWTEPARRKGIRAHLVSQLWSMVNELTKSAIKHAKRRTADEQLNALIASLARTKTGRAALASHGVVVEVEK